MNENCKSRIILVTSGKGGVGKTTLVANLGASLARLNYSVLLIDCDVGLRNLDLILGLENRVLRTGLDFIEGKCSLNQALIRDKRWNNLYLLALSGVHKRFSFTNVHLKTLYEALNKQKFDFILIDSPAGIDVGFLNAMSLSNEALIVATPDVASVRDADRAIAILESHGILKIHLIINKINMKLIHDNNIMSVGDVQIALGIPLLGIIPNDDNVIISTNIGQPIILNNQLSLNLAVLALENSARRLIGKKDNLIDLTLK